MGAKRAAYITIARQRVGNRLPLWLFGVAAISFLLCDVRAAQGRE